MPARQSKPPKKWGMYSATASKKVEQLEETVRKMRSGEISVSGVTVDAACSRLEARIAAIKAGTSR